MALQYCDSPSHLDVGISGSRSCVALSNCAQFGTSVKIGGLWKRSQGVSRFTKPNYKHRVFILTDQALSYYGGSLDRVGQLKGRVALDSVRAVEFVDISAFNLAHALQVVHVSKKSGFTTLYIIATTKEECSDWVATLRQACYFNRDMLMHYHPGAFVKGKWNCCIQRGRTTLGCQPTYHLLTRSSSRYAQMRRKDTLTSITNSQRRAKAGSRGSQAFADHRRSTGNSNIISTDIEDTFGSDIIISAASHGLSNSFVELSRHPPHTEDMFAMSSPSASRRSRRSSKNSTEPSVGVGTMTLSHMSVSEICACGEDQMEEAAQESDRPSLRNGNLSQSQRHHYHHHYSRPERGRKGGRSQVAPTWPAEPSHQLSQERHSYELELRTLPRSFKSRSPASSATSGLNNSWNASASTPLRRKVRNHVSREDEEEATSPVPPPRTKKASTSSSGCGRAPPSASSPLDSAPLSQPLPLSPHHQPIGLKHSKTFAAHPPTSNVTSPGGVATAGAVRKFQTKGFGFSQSMGALAKPVIEPKVSSSNPNVIHV